MRSISSSPVATRTIATWLTLVVTVGFMFGARALVARALGPVGIGLYALMLTAGWLGGTVLSVGLPAYNASFAGKHPPGVLLANSVAWNLAGLGVLSLLCIPALLSPALSITAKMIVVGILMAPFMALLDCTRGILQGTSAIASYNWLGFLAGALNLAIIGLLVAGARLTLAAAVACWIGSTAVTAMGAIALVAKSEGGLARPDGAVLRGGFKFGGQAWLTQLTGIVNFRIGLLLTQALLGTAAVGLYAVAVTIAEVLFYFPNALAIVTSARYAAATRTEGRALLQRSTAWVLVLSAGFALVIALAARPVILLVFGGSYGPSVEALWILLPGVVLYTPVAVAVWYFNAHLQKPVANLIVAAVSAVINGCLTLLWAPQYGLNGVAAATTTGYIAGSFVNVMLIKRESTGDARPPAGSFRRLVWRGLGVLDLAVAVPAFLVVPRHVRFKWSAPGTVLRNRRGADEVVKLVGPAARRALVLDVGGGIAALKDLPDSEVRMRVITLDLDMAMLSRARRKVPHAELVCADGTRLPFRDDTFDVVVMVHAMEHIPEEVRPELVSEIKRVSRHGVVIHGPAGEDAIDLTRRFIAALEARGGEAPRYALEHLEFPMPMPDWFRSAFPGCELQPRRNLEVEFETLLMAYTPILRWFAGYRNQRLSAADEKPPFVEYTMTWRKPRADAPARDGGGQ